MSGTKAPQAAAVIHKAISSADLLRAKRSFYDDLLLARRRMGRQPARSGDVLLFRFNAERPSAAPVISQTVLRRQPRWHPLSFSGHRFVRLGAHLRGIGYATAADPGGNRFEPRIACRWHRPFSDTEQAGMRCCALGPLNCLRMRIIWPWIRYRGVHAELTTEQGGATIALTQLLADRCCRLISHPSGIPHVSLEGCHRARKFRASSTSTAHRRFWLRYCFPHAKCVRPLTMISVVPGTAQTAISADCGPDDRP